METKNGREIESGERAASKDDQAAANAGGALPATGRGRTKKSADDRDTSINTDIYRDVNRELPA